MGTLSVYGAQGQVQQVQQVESTKANNSSAMASSKSLANGLIKRNSLNHKARSKFEAIIRWLQAYSLPFSIPPPFPLSQFLFLRAFSADDGVVEVFADGSGP